jgi:TonB family protein
MRGRSFLTVSCLLLLLAHAPAADPPKTSNPQQSVSSVEPQLKVRDIPAVDTQKQAEAMLAHARDLSDVRAPGAAPFHLTASFSFVDDELETFDGTYSEFWLSDSKWRKEIVVGDMRKVSIAGDRKLWELESGPPLSEKALRVEFATELFPSPLSKMEFESLQSIPDDPAAKCAVTKPASLHKDRSALCFDQTNGVLTERIIPTWSRHHLADFSCAYSEFKQFAGRWFPFEMDCRQAGHRQMQVHVTGLTASNPDDAKLFEPPADAVELGRCPAGETSAKPDYTPAPLQPASLRNEPSSVTMRLVVDAKGKARNIQFVHPANKFVDEAALGTVEQWRFKPATCDGEPMAQRIELEVLFRSY